ncbi:MAG TPA: ABC transporter permease [Longimicrobiales bacterium]
MKRLDWFVARRYLSSARKGRFGSFSTMISILGVAVGVMALLVVIAVMTGLQRDLQAKILGSSPHVYVMGPAGDFRVGNWQQAMAEARETPGVVGAEPFTYNNVVLVRPSDIKWSKPAILQGIDPLASKVPLTQVERDIREGNLPWGPTRSGLPGVLIGYRLATEMRLFTGDTVVIATFENLEPTAFGGISPNMESFEVTGTFETGMYEYDRMNVYADLAAAQAFAGLSPDTVAGIAVNVVDPWRADEMARTIEERLGGSQAYSTRTWTSLNGALFNALKLEKLAMSVILMLIILVASFNIVSTLMMLVTEKTREIGILKSMGMTDASVLRVFMVQGLIIGLVGTSLGLVAGLGIVYVIDRFGLIDLPPEVYFLDKLPVKLDPVDVGLVVIVSLLIAFLATIYPAWRASRLVPVEAIRHD